MALKRLIHVLPVLIFPSLSFAAGYLILNRSLYQNGLQSEMNAICHPSAPTHPFRLAYTNKPAINKVLCGMVAFFHGLMDTTYRPLLAEAATAFGALVLVLFLEDARDKRSVLLRMPVAIGMLCQIASMGVTSPLYSLLFILSGAASVHPTITTRVNQANAEALLSGFVFGYVLPTVLMVFFELPVITASWQVFPFFIAIAAFVHKLGRPPSKLTSSGHTTVRGTLILLFVIAALVHAFYVLPIIKDVDALKTMFIPDMSTPDPTKTSLTQGVVEFMKWDLIFGAGSLILATLWMADSTFKLVGIVLWHVVATVAFGPGAAVAGVFLWRENRLEKAEKMLKKTH